MLQQYFATLLLIFGCYGSDESPLVHTHLGTIRGYLKTSNSGRKFSAFEGIPYAEPPIGERRFEEPEPVQPWHGTWNANLPTECAQTVFLQPNTTTGDEDCLHVNVYVPREHPNPKEKLDVLVHIHGGAFMYGSGHAFTPPEYPLDKDIIFVTFNYRLGILGFLSTEDDVVPGNNGLKDQALALKWIQENIANFGGNPNSVTLNGGSAGGLSVHLHYFTELSKGLFHRGFSESGLALNPWSIAEEPLNKAKKLADAIGCPLDSTRILIDCLKQRPYRQILNKMGLFFGYKFLPFAPFAPVIEKGGSKPFLKGDPYDMLIKGEVQDVPFISSLTSHEGTFPVLFFAEDLDYIDENWNELAPFLLDFNHTLPKSSWKSTSQKIRKQYLGEEKITKQNLLTLVQIFSDRYFVADGETAIRLHAKATNSPVYFLSFGYTGDNNNDKTAGHGAEGKYMYGPSQFAPGPLTDNELQMKELLWDMVVSYAETSKPVFKGVEWTPTEFDTLTYLNVTGIEPEHIKLQTTEEFTNRKFWRQLQFTESENLFTPKDEL